MRIGTTISAYFLYREAFFWNVVRIAQIAFDPPPSGSALHFFRTLFYPSDRRHSPPHTHKKGAMPKYMDDFLEKGLPVFIYLSTYILKGSMEAI